MYVADVGLGDGPRGAFEVKDGEFEEAGGFKYSFQSRGGQQWRFQHDERGSFEGFSVDLSTSVVAMKEFESYHRFYSKDPGEV